MNVQERTYLLKELLLEIDSRNLNCEERFKNIKTVQEDFKEINQRDLDTKAIDFWFDAETEEIAREQMDLLSDRMLSNTVIEDWEYELEETEETGIGNISNDNAGTSKHALFDA